MVKKKTNSIVYIVVKKTYNRVNLVSPDIDILGVYKSRRSAEENIKQEKGNVPRHTYTRHEIIKRSLKG